MTGARPVPTRLVPTLTEVVEMGGDGADDSSTLQLTPTASLEAPAPTASASPAAAPGEPAASPPASEADQLAERVLADVQQRVEQVFEDRLLQVLTPALLKLGEAWAEQAGRELAATLRGLVAEAVADEMARRREPR